MVGLLMVMVLLVASCDYKESKSSPRVSVKELVGMKGCPYCHDVRRQLLGPSFLEISKRYSENDKDLLIKSILQGSKGKWGENVMPPQKVSEEEARIIVEWILSLSE